MAAQRTGARLRFLDIDDEGRLDLAALDELLGERTRLVSLAHVSNALGTVNPVREIARARPRAWARSWSWTAPSPPRTSPWTCGELGCDFFAFSGHKMCGPTGIGGLWGRRELLEAMPPFLGGGDMIEVVELERSTYAPLPHKFEAGTPNIAGAIGLARGRGLPRRGGTERIQAHEPRAHWPTRWSACREVPDLRRLRPARPRRSAPAWSPSPWPTCTRTTSPPSWTPTGVAIRAGHHCAQPLMRRLGGARHRPRLLLPLQHPRRRGPAGGGACATPCTLFGY